MSNLTTRAQRALVSADSSSTTRKAVGTAAMTVGVSALAVPVLAAFIPFVGPVFLSILMILAGLAFLVT